MNKLDITRFSNFSGRGMIYSPRVFVYIGEAWVQCHEVSVTQSGHQEGSTCSLSFANIDKAYDDFVNMQKSTIEVYLGYDIVIGNQRSFYGERVFYGVSTSKKLSESKSNGSVVTIEARDFSVIAQECKMTGMLDGMTIEQVITLISSSVYGREWTKKHLILNLPETAKDNKYGELEGIHPLEIDQRTFWDVAIEIASDFALQSYFTTDGEWYFGSFPTEDNPQKIKIYNFIRGVNVSAISFEYKNPSSITNKIRYLAYDETDQTMLVSETQTSAGELGSADLSNVYSAQQNHTLNVTNDKMVNPSALEVLGKMRLWEEMRQIKTIQLSSEYGIPSISAGSIIQLIGYNSHSGYYFVRSVSHQIDKSGGYRMNISTEDINPFTTIKIINKDGTEKYGSIKDIIDTPSLGTGTNIDTTLGQNCPETGLLFPADGTYSPDIAYCHKKINGAWVKIDCSAFRENDLENYFKSYGNRFGIRVHPTFNDLRLHTGIDIDGLHGADLYAAADGIVTQIGTVAGYGNRITICLDRKFKVGDTSNLQDEGGIVGRNGAWYIRYAHLSKYATGIKKGSHVGKGQVIGYMGNTGTSTEPHLHFELLKEVNGKMEPIDPAPCIIGIGVQYDPEDDSSGDEGSTDPIDEGLNPYVNAFFKVFNEDQEDVTDEATIRIDSHVVSVSSGGFVAVVRNTEHTLMVDLSGYERVQRKIFYNENSGNSAQEHIYMQKVQEKNTDFVNVEIRTFDVGGNELTNEILVYVDDEYINLAPVSVKLAVDVRTSIRVGSENYEYDVHKVIAKKDTKTLCITCKEK
jgi:hypothetical protein